MITRHLMAKHKACYFTGSQNYASFNEELINRQAGFAIKCKSNGLAGIFLQ